MGVPWPGPRSIGDRGLEVFRLGRILTGCHAAAPVDARAEHRPVLDPDDKGARFVAGNEEMLVQVDDGPRRSRRSQLLAWRRRTLHCVRA